jgi:hypothetical protein
MKTKNFTVTVDDKEVELLVRTPTSADRKESQKYYNNAFTEALKSGAIVRAKLEDVLVEQGLWNDEKQVKFDTIQRQLNDNERKLERGGIPLSAAKEVAMEMRKLRAEFREIIADKTSLDTHSAEGQADSERFNYFVYACTFHPDGKKRYFNSYKEYMDKGDDPVSVKAASELANLMYGLEADYELKLPENKFLKDYHFVDEKLRFINKEGKLTDSEGRLINEDGRFIDAEGNFVDKYGNSIDEAGNYKVEFKPFTDDDGKPVVLETKEKEEPVKKTKKTTSKKTTEEPKEEE